MTGDQFKARVSHLSKESLPLPGGGNTADRHRRLIEIGREDLSVAKIAEAHWDAIAILHEAGASVKAGCLYGVWASEVPGSALTLSQVGSNFRISGTKQFCSGAGLLDWALVTVGLPEQQLVAVDLRANLNKIEIHTDVWQIDSFRETKTGTVVFQQAEVEQRALIATPRWYVERAGFWNGALGPAACWVGGAMGLLDYACRSKRNDPHTLAHLGAMDADLWSLRNLLDIAGQDIDKGFVSNREGQIRALRTRHIVEQGCTDVLRRFARAFGPYPLAMDPDISRRYAELDLSLRQVHGERDLETLGQSLRNSQ